MITKEYAEAYKEVVTILSYVPEEDLQKIPQDKINFYIESMDKEYEYILDENIEFEEQTMSDITKAILANIFRDYWATPYQKERIEAKEKYDIEKEEEEKREKYNPDDIFKSRQVDSNTANTNLPMEIRKENFFKKLISFIKRFIKK